MSYNRFIIYTQDRDNAVEINTKSFILSTLPVYMFYDNRKSLIGFNLYITSNSSYNPYNRTFLLGTFDSVEECIKEIYLINTHVENNKTRSYKVSGYRGK